jgi:DNA-binding IclR family transcriptional regulator
LESLLRRDSGSPEKNFFRAFSELATFLGISPYFFWGCLFGNLTVRNSEFRVNYFHIGNKWNRVNSMAEEKKPYGTVLIKAAKIIDFLSDSREGQTLTAIAANTGLSSPTALKILDTLLLIGYAEKDEQNKIFTLGTALIRHANNHLAGLDIIKVTDPYLKNLQASLDETVHLGILDKDEVLYVNKLETQKAIANINSRIGNTNHLYSSAMGKALLAEFDEEALADYLKRVELVADTPKTITDVNVLQQQIAKVKEDGYATDDEESDLDVICIGAALVVNGKTYGAFSVSTPKYRFEKEQTIAKVLETKRQLLAELKRLNPFNH